MSAVAATDPKNRRHQYKEYVSFLDTYRSGKKDETDSGITSLSNSSNNSSSSICSDLSSEHHVGIGKASFKNYLDSYNSKKYSPVQPAFIKKPAEGKTVKMEVFIEIKPPRNGCGKQISKVVELPKQEQANSTTVSEVSKLFEKNCGNPEAKTKRSPTACKIKVNTFNFDQANKQDEQKRTTIGEISRKFEEQPVKSQKSPEVLKVHLKKQSSISEMSKVFEEIPKPKPTEAKSEIEVRKNIFSTVSKVFQQKEEVPENNNGSSPKPPIAVKNTSGFMNGNKECSISSKHVQNGTVSKEIVITLPIQNVSTNGTSVDIPPPPPMQPLRPTPNDVKNVSGMANPPPPPPMQIESNPVKNFASQLQQSLSVGGSISQPTPKREVQLPPISPPPPTCSVPPPPPPPPPADFSVKKVQTSPAKLAMNTNGSNTLPRAQNGRKDITDGIPLPIIDKNDPRVKRLVYKAMRESLGAYHDRANDYIATLPRDRVRKNNGLDSIINSIASQGGLEKLTGRGNPGVENE